VKKLKVYLDTSVISYLYQLDAPEKMEETKRLWEIFKEKELYEVYISNVVFEEINKCKEDKRRILLNYLYDMEYNVVETDDGVIELADKIIDWGILKQKSYDDCRHIASAILAGCDIIASWNFKHIVNVKTIRGVKVITTLEGYKDLLIYPPSVRLEKGDDSDGEAGNKWPI